MKKCPFCAEDIQEAAIICRFCRGSLAPASQPQSAPPARHTAPTYIALAVIAGLLVLVGLNAAFNTARPSSTAALGSPAPAMQLFVTVGLDAIQVTNETAAAWDSCTVTIQGGYTADIALLKPKATGRIPYDDFKSGELKIPAHEGYVRGKSRTDVSCSGVDYERHVASFTSK